VHVGTGARRLKCSRVVATLRGITKLSSFVGSRGRAESVCLLFAVFDVLLLVGGVHKAKCW
jgi:hypothetical protein